MEESDSQTISSRMA